MCSAAVGFCGTHRLSLRGWGPLLELHPGQSQVQLLLSAGAFGQEEIDQEVGDAEGVIWVQWEGVRNVEREGVHPVSSEWRESVSVYRNKATHFLKSSSPWS